MNILALNGSGRPFGNNYNILNLCLESFKKNNSSVELINLAGLDIKSCQSCYNCKSDEMKCAREDDMASLTKKLMGADIFILSAPIYMWQVSAKVKLFMERLYPLFHFDKPSELKGKKLILIFTQATPDKARFKDYFEYVKEAFLFLGFDVVDVIVIPGLRKAEDYKNQPDLLNQIAALGNRDWV